MTATSPRWLSLNSNELELKTEVQLLSHTVTFEGLGEHVELVAPVLHGAGNRTFPLPPRLLLNSTVNVLTPRLFSVGRELQSTREKDGWHTMKSKLLPVLPHVLLMVKHFSKQILTSGEDLRSPVLTHSTRGLSQSALNS